MRSSRGTLSVLGAIALAMAGCGADDLGAIDGQRSALLGVVAAPPPPGARPSAPVAGLAPTVVPGQLIVKFRAAASDDQRRAALRGLRTPARVVRSLAGDALLVRVEDPSPSSTPAADLRGALLVRGATLLQELRANPSIEYAHEDLLAELSAVPSDPLYPRQWHLQAIGLPQALDATQGNVTVAVIDTGMLPHPDLAGQWAPGYDAANQDFDATAEGSWAHGLAVASVVAARTNNGLGVAGTCPGCKVMPIKIEQANNSILLSAIGDGIQRAFQVGNPRVMNMSFAGRGSCANVPFLQDAIRVALNRNTVLVAAAGNDSGQAADYWPANCDGVIAVAASDPRGQLASYSNRGPRVDLTAPGGGAPLYGVGIGCPADPTNDPYNGTAGVITAWAVSKPAATLQAGDYCYRGLSGTSLAAPHVAGIAALLLSQDPTLTPAAVKQRLQATARPIPGCSSDCGAGLVDAARAVFPRGPIVPTSGPWYNAARSGWGLSLSRNSAGSVLLQWFTYDRSGNPTWYQALLAPSGAAWRGALSSYRWTGGATGSATGTVRGQATLMTSSSTSGTFSWVLDNVPGSEPVSFLRFANGAPRLDLTGAWYLQSQVGWGTFFAVQDNAVVADVALYGASGEPTWLHGTTTSNGPSTGWITLQRLTGINLCPNCTGSPQVVVGPDLGRLRMSNLNAARTQATQDTVFQAPFTLWSHSGATATRLTF